MDKSIEQALQIFWLKGYESTSLTDLITAMGINRPSLYAAFGNKEDLFRKVLNYYENGPCVYISDF
jgi:AcrR family transcriptional regulator